METSSTRSAKRRGRGGRVPGGCFQQGSGPAIGKAHGMHAVPNLTSSGNSASKDPCRAKWPGCQSPPPPHHLVARRQSWASSTDNVLTYVRASLENARQFSGTETGRTMRACQWPSPFLTAGPLWPGVGGYCMVRHEVIWLDQVIRALSAKGPRLRKGLRGVGTRA